jgi:hypothetical protein
VINNSILKELKMNVIEQLRKAGNRVRVTHYREFYELNHLGRPVIKFKARHEVPKGYMQRALPRGGVTEVEVITPNGKSVRGITICSNKDAFCKREGVNKAMEKVLINLAKAV